jgi:hypothetical protein
LELELIGKEKDHYDALEKLHLFGRGDTLDEVQLSKSLSAMIADWERMKGSSGRLLGLTESYITEIGNGDRDSARIAYLYLSPLFFFIIALNKAYRKEYRETVTACGILCERVVRNLMVEADRNFHTSEWEQIKDKPLDSKNGKLKSILEGHKFDASDLHGEIHKIYNVRNMRGPHDVPPAEPLQVKISINECLPAYVDYLRALEHIGVELGKDSERFIELFGDTTTVSPNLVFGEEIGGTIPVREFITGILFREGFFRDGKTSTEVIEEMRRRRYNYDEATVKNALRALSQGKNVVLNRRPRGAIFVYHERIPPSEYFKPII